MTASCRILASLVFVLEALLCAQSGEARETTVGAPLVIRDLLLPGPELLAKPVMVKDALQVRILRAEPSGSAWRYDLEILPFEPGEIDLAKGLVRKGGSEPADLPPVKITVHSLRPPSEVLPHPLATGSRVRVGGYRAWMLLLGIFWLGGLAILLWTYRRRRAASSGTEKAITAADRLRPLIQRALRKELASGELAELERRLIGLWSKKLGLSDQPMATLLQNLRTHAEAGPLLLGLESWLHRPDPETGVDLEALLAPYQSLPETALEAGSPPSGGALATPGKGH